MKKLLFQKFLKDTFKFFLIICFSIGVIVWVVQAVSFLDFITEDGHGLNVYFSYTILNFPKIIHRILPFVFFISLFYQINQYEVKNELIVFWTHGINKLQFVNAILIYSLIFLLFQIFLGSYVSPLGQNEARSYIRNSNIDFFPALIKEGKFIDTVEKLTIFIGSKDESGNYKNVYLQESINLSKSLETQETKTIYAKTGSLKNTPNSRYLELLDGEVIDKSNGKIDSFTFQKVDFDLTKYSSKTTTYPKIQELNIMVLVRCWYYSYSKKIKEFNDEYLNCEEGNMKPVAQEVSKRLFKPMYIPLLALLTSLIILKTKEDIRYDRYKIFLFLIVIFVIVISEISLRYVSNNSIGLLFFILFPIITFLITYIYLRMKLPSENKI